MDRDIESRELQHAMKKGRTRRGSIIKEIPFYSRVSGIVSISLALTLITFCLIADELQDIVPSVVVGIVVMGVLLGKSVRDYRNYWFR